MSVKLQPSRPELEERRRVLAEVLEKFSREKLVLNENAILKEMRRKGYPEYSRMMLFNDKTKLNVQSNYIRYFLPNYSAYQENINRILQFVVSECEKGYRKTYTQSKKVTKTIEGPKGETEVTEETITAELPAPKVWFLNTMLRATKLMQDHSAGRNVDIAAIALQKEFENKDKQITDLEKKLEDNQSKNLPVVVK